MSEMNQHLLLATEHLNNQEITVSTRNNKESQINQKLFATHVEEKAIMLRTVEIDNRKLLETAIRKLALLTSPLITMHLVLK